MSIIVLHFDGACEPVNPGGTASFGYTITVDDKDFECNSGVIGSGPDYSNNYAEFYALYMGLKKIREFVKPNDIIRVNGDSQLVINVAKKRWRAKGGLYYPAYELAAHELYKIRQRNVGVVFNWIPREDNTRADDLSKKHLQ